MDDVIRSLRDQIRIHIRARRAKTVRYPAPVREAAILLARRRVKAGSSVRRTADELGLRTATLYLWLGRKPSKRLRPVRVVDSPDPVLATGSGGGAILVTPHGLRIEGLDTAGLVAVLRALA
jgi:hypothetical protein